MRFDHGITVTVVRSGGADPYGNPLPGSEHDIDGCGVAPRSSEEREDGQATVTTGYSLFAPYGSDLTAQDNVRLAGEDPAKRPAWRVDGAPASWESPFTGWQAGVAAVLTRTEG